MMKKLVSSMSALALAVIIATPALGHTHLTETNPADGATVTKAITELTLNFDGEVGEGSFIELTSSSGEEIDVPTIEIDEMNMVATLAEPLANNTYTVDWSIISADGHPLQGSYTFTVDAPVKEEVTPEPIEETTVEEEAPVQAEENQSESSNSTTLIIAAVLAVVLLGSLVALLKRKK